MSSDRYIIEREDNRVTRLDNRFYPDGKGGWVPSSTTILAAWPKGPEFFAWLKKHGEAADDILFSAGDQGTEVHRLTEEYDKGNEVSCYKDERGLIYTDQVWQQFERYTEFRERMGDRLKVHMIERSMASEKLGYGGTLDRLWTLDDNWLLTDIKTGKNIHEHYWAQQASYWNLLRADGFAHIDQLKISILHLNAATRTDKDGKVIQGKGWQLIVDDRPIKEHLADFDAAHHLYKRVFGDLQPRNLTYKITHKLVPAT